MNGNNIWAKGSPAAEEAIIKLIAECPFRLPTEYTDLLKTSNGGEGQISSDPGWLILWKAEEVCQFNAEFKVAEYAPGFWGFGDNGGGEILAFDFRSDPPSIVALPMIGLESQAALFIAGDFVEFADAELKTKTEH